jgi:hypothetical protein
MTLVLEIGIILIHLEEATSNRLSRSKALGKILVYSRLDQSCNARPRIVEKVGESQGKNKKTQISHLLLKPLFLLSILLSILKIRKYLNWYSQEWYKLISDNQHSSLQ